MTMNDRWTEGESRNLSGMIDAIESERGAIVDAAIAEDARADALPIVFKPNGSPMLLQHVSSFEIGGIVPRSIMPCQNCGELLDVAHDTCSCWQLEPPMTARENNAKKWQIAKWCSDRNAKIILSGAHWMDIDIAAYMEVGSDRDRAVIEAAHTHIIA